MTDLFDPTNIDKYYFDNVNDVILKDIVLLTKDTYNKIDMLMYKYYGTMDYLSIILSFNNYPDITEIPIGTLFKIPELKSLLENIVVLEDLDYMVPGINELNKQKLVNTSTKSKNTIASPKLNISLKSVNYDDETGTITF